MSRRLLIWVGIAVVAWGLFRLKFDADVLNLLPAELPAVGALKLHQQRFATGAETLITLSGAEAGDAAKAAERVANRLRSMPEIARSVHWQSPWLENTGDAVENLAWLWLQQDPAALSSLLDRLGQPEVQLESAVNDLTTSLDPKTLAMAAYDPLGLAQLPGSAGSAIGKDDGAGLFSGDEGRFRVVSLQPSNPKMDYKTAALWVERVRQEVAQTIASESLDIRIGMTGGPVFLSEIAIGMERDLRNSVLLTVVVIAFLFWIAHRSLRPLVCLVGSLAVTLVVTIALGGLFLGTLNVISTGFAAVLIGLVVDYGLVAYQEARVHPNLNVNELRRRIAPGIGWSAVTTAGTFSVLGLTGLPGLSQLGLLTAIGLMVGAVVMLFGFLPIALKQMPSEESIEPKLLVTNSGRPKRWWLPTAIALSAIALTLGLRGLPKATASSDPLRPNNSPAYESMDRLQAALGRTNDTIWLIVRGKNPEAVGRLLISTEVILTQARDAGKLSEFQIPTAFWPMASNAAQNLPKTAALSEKLGLIKAAVLHAGFTTNSTILIEEVGKRWEQWRKDPAGIPLWPSNPTAQWIRDRCSATDSDGSWLALGLVTPMSGSGKLPNLPEGVLSASWNRLGESLWDHVLQRVISLTIGLSVVLIIALWLAFRRIAEVIISLVALISAFALLLAGMAALGATWNLLNLVAIPLLLGSSVDSTIHIQLAMRRYGSDRRALWASTGRALLLCAGANIAGFGSLAWSNNAGLASLDLVCAGGVACVFVVAVILLPSWWLACGLNGRSMTTKSPSKVSQLYRSHWWGWGRTLVACIPRNLATSISRQLGALYATLNPQRRNIVAANLLPVLGNKSDILNRRARDTFREFGGKLADLLLFESGVSLDAWVEPGNGWQHFDAARASGKGVLLVTIHLGNWELGSVLLRRMGLSPLVLTAPEPTAELTQLRLAARERLGIETLVVGENPFQFVEVVKRLQDGGIVAILVDRPPIQAAVPSPFLGGTTGANIATAELARATGCIILPVYVVRHGSNYLTHVLKPVEYERGNLGSRETRRELASRVLQVFEAAVREHPEQWYHFVPIWTQTSDSTQ